MILPTREIANLVYFEDQNKKLTLQTRRQVIRVCEHFYPLFRKEDSSSPGLKRSTRSVRLTAAALRVTGRFA